MPVLNKIRIGIFGLRNSGKSTLMNRLCGYPVSIISDQPGTTTDPVKCTIEVPQMGPCILIDTAGFDDIGCLGKSKVSRTKQIISECDIALFVFSKKPGVLEAAWIALFKKYEIPIIGIVNEKQSGINRETDISIETSEFPLLRINLLKASDLEECWALIKQTIRHPAEFMLTEGFVQKGDIVMLVIPQDQEAPKDRLILPQVQTIRELVDKECIPICCTPENMELSFLGLSKIPALVIADSRVISSVFDHLKIKIPVTTFSILLARQKGNITCYLDGIAHIDQIKESDRILIAEACCHVAKPGDIGRDLIPYLLRKHIGSTLQVEIVSGNDFPEDLSPYALIILCGACMVNRKVIQYRIREASIQGIPITNYGIFIAWAQNVLSKIRCQ